MRQSFQAFVAFTLLSGVSVAATLPVMAADTVPVETRVDRLEKEMKAVQRKVFPAGVPVQPDIVQSTTPTAQPLPSSTPITDLTARVTSLETQLATLTGQVEQNSYKLKQLEARFDQLKASAEAGASDTSTVGPVTEPKVSTAPASVAKPAVKPAATPAATAKPTAASDKRKAAIADIQRPDTGNAAEDAYTYGYRLWDAKFYPEAQAQLKSTVEKYGTTSVGSRAANLLGRAYLDEGKPALASVTFYENYQKRPKGDRAAQSLTYLGESLIQLKKPADACKVYNELESHMALLCRLIFVR